MKIIIVTTYLLMLVLAIHMVGWWTLIPGIGFPLLFFVIFIVVPAINNVKLRKFSKLLGEVIDIAKQHKPTQETHSRAERVVLSLGVRIDKGDFQLKKELYEQLSNEYLGKFLAHLLIKTYHSKVFLGIARSLKEKRPADVQDVLSFIRELNPEAATEIEKYYID